MENSVRLAGPVSVLCAFAQGMGFSLLGSIGIKLMPRLRMDQARFGTLILAVMSSCLIMSLVLGVVIDTFGYRPVAIFGFVATATCICLLAFSRSYKTILGSCFLLGSGLMALSMAAMTLMPRVLFSGRNPAAASNLGNAFFGLGLFLTPLLVSYLFQVTSYERAVSALGLIVLAPVVLAVMASYPQSQTSSALSNALALLSEPAVLLAACALFCYSSLEQSFSNWLPAFGKELFLAARPQQSVRVTDASAQRLLALFAVGMMAGRFAASQIPQITELGSWFVAFSSLLAAGVIVAMSVAKGLLQPKLLALVAGIALAPCFPTIVGITFAKFKPETYGSIFGIIFAAGMLGGAILPKAIGNLARASSIQKSLKLLIPACILLAVAVIVLGRIRGTS